MSPVMWILLLSFAAWAVWKLRSHRRRFASLEQVERIKLGPWFGAYIFLYQNSAILSQMIIGTSKVFLERSMVMAWPFLSPYLLINGPRQVEALLRSRNIAKSREYDAMKPWLGQGLIVASGGNWRLHRRLLTPSFYNDVLESYVSVFAEHGRVLMTKLSGFAERGEVFDIWPLLNLCTLDAICEAIIGRHFNSQTDNESEYARAVCRLTKIVRERMQKPWLWNHFIFSLTAEGREQSRSLAVIHGFGTKVVREKLAQRKRLQDRQRRDSKADLPSDASDSIDPSLPEADQNNNRDKASSGQVNFLDLLAAEGLLSEREIRDQLDTFVFAGHDTSTMGLNWSLFLLGHHPEQQKRVQEELDLELASSDDWSLESLRRLVFLENCFKEALRLYPPVPLMGRRLDEDLQIDDVNVPKGTSVTFSPYTIHRDAEFWEDPERFDPDRFSIERSQSRHPFAYLPFSAGSRNCLGQRFATLEAKVLLGMILRKFHVESVDKRHEVPALVELVLRPAAPIRLRLTPR